MPRLAANLSMLFTERAFLQRFEAAANAGFEGVEYQFPYAYDVTELRDELVSHSLTQVLFNLPAGDWAGGERGIACHPDRVDEFKAGVEEAIRYAQALGNRQVNCLAGIIPQGVDSTLVQETLVSNLRYAAEQLAKAKIKLLVEAINTRDIPGFYLSGSRQAQALINQVGSDNLAYQYDIYHMQIMEGDICPTLEAHRNIIAHIQIADTPGRNEPGTGEIYYPNILNFLDRIGYRGWVGCEYKPVTTTESGLGWIEECFPL